MSARPDSFGAAFGGAMAQMQGEWWRTEGDGSESEDEVLVRVGAGVGLRYEGRDPKSGELRFSKLYRVSRHVAEDYVASVRDMRLLVGSISLGTALPPPRRVRPVRVSEKRREER